MREYDIALKNLLTRGSGTLLKRFTGLDVAVWHNVELPIVQMRQADLLGETAEGQLLHVELQSTNDPAMADRMLKYSVAIKEKFDQYPERLALYVGRAPLRMPTVAVGPGLECHCPMVDIREVESVDLLKSPSLEDNVLAVLARFQDAVGTIHEILKRIAAGGPRRDSALAELLLLAGLRKLGPIIREELEQMPILEDIMDHDLIGPAIRQGIAQGRVEGRAEGERRLIVRMLERRFGTLPANVSQHIEKLSVAELEDLGLRCMDAASMDELFG